MPIESSEINEHFKAINSSFAVRQLKKRRELVIHILINVAIDN